MQPKSTPQGPSPPHDTSRRDVSLSATREAEQLQFLCSFSYSEQFDWLTPCNFHKGMFICKSRDPKRPQRLASNDQPARTADRTGGLRPPSSFLRAKKPPRTRPATAHSIPKPTMRTPDRRPPNQRLSCSGTPSAAFRKPRGSHKPKLTWRPG